MRDYREALLADMKAIDKLTLQILKWRAYFCLKPRCARILVSSTAISYTVCSTVTRMLIS